MIFNFINQLSHYNEKCNYTCYCYYFTLLSAHIFLILLCIIHLHIAPVSVPSSYLFIYYTNK